MQGKLLVTYQERGAALSEDSVLLVIVTKIVRKNVMDLVPFHIVLVQVSGPTVDLSRRGDEPVLLETLHKQIYDL